MLAPRLATVPFILVMTVLALICNSAAPHDNAREDYRSPDRKLVAVVIKVNTAHESRIEIRNSKGKRLLVKDYSSPDMEHGQMLCKAAWTPDAEFFVFAMSNTGGHSPLARTTFFYIRNQNRIVDLDRAVGYITTCDFTVMAPDWVITKRLDETADSDKSISLRVALSTLVK